MEYKQTLNMNKSGFPMRGGLPMREPDMLKHWQELDLYNELLKKNEGKPLFALLRVFLHGGAAGLFVHDVFHPSKFYGQHRRSARAQWTKLPVVSHKHTTSGRRLQSHGRRSDLNNY